MITLPTATEIADLWNRHVDCAEIARRWAAAHPDDDLDVVWGWYGDEMHAWLEGYDTDLGGWFVLDLSAEQFGETSGLRPADDPRYRADSDLTNTW